MIIAAILAAPLALYAVFRIVQAPEVGVYLFIFLSAITVTPHLPFVGQRLIVADVVMLLVLLISLLNGTFFTPAPEGRRLADQLGLLFISIVMVSGLVALAEGKDLGRISLFLLIYLYGYCGFRVILRLIDTRTRLWRALIAWGLGAAVLTLFGFLASTGVFRPSWSFDPVINRISGTMRESGQVASYLAPTLLIYCYVATRKRVPLLRALLVLALMGMASVVMVGTGSRVAMAMIVLTVLLCLTLTLMARDGGTRKWSILIGTVAGSVGFGMYAVSVWTDLSESYGLVSTSPFERAIRIFAETSRASDGDISAWGGTRYQEVKFGFDNIAQHPLFGIGPGVFSSIYQMNEIHNTYINILIENGLLAFAVFIPWWGAIGAALISTLRHSVGEQRLILYLALSGFLTLAIYQVTTNGMRQRPFWFGPALALCLARPVTEQRALFPAHTAKWAPV